MADKLLGYIKEFDPGFEFKYNKFYIGLVKDGQPNNFAVFRPRKSGLNFEFKLPYSEQVQKIVDQAGLDDMGYLKRWQSYRLRLRKEDIQKRSTILKEFLLKAYKNSQ